LETVAWSIGRLRHLMWNLYHEEAHDELLGMRHMASEAAYLNGEKFRPAFARLLCNCDDLRRYLANNVGSPIDYGSRYAPSFRFRRRRQKVVSTRSLTREWQGSSGCGGRRRKLIAPQPSAPLY
jgi:hypothetical protein